MRCSLLVGLVGVLALCSGVGAEGRSVRSLRSLRLPHAAPPAAAAAAAAAAPQLASSQCGFDGRDFSSLMGADLVGSDGSSRYQYYLSLCGPLSSPAASACAQVQAGSSACQLEVEGGYQAFDLGDWDSSSPPAWSYINASRPEVGVQYTLTGANQCWAEGGAAQPYTATVHLICAKSQGPLTVLLAPGSCLVTFQLPTPLACGPPTPKPFDCTFTDAQGNFFDFNRLTTANGTLVVGQASDLYHINVCGGTPSIPACTDAALCMEFVYFRGDYYQLALSHAAPAPVFSSDSATGVVSLTYNNGKMDSTPATTVFQFVCTHDGSTSYTAKRVSQSQWVVQVATPLACIRPQTECGFAGRDFSSLAGSDMVGSDGQSRYAFYLRLCGAVQSAPAATCAQVNGHTGACQIQTQGGAQTFDLGEWDPAQPPKWEFIDSNAPAKGVQYTMQGARQCWGSGVAEVYVTTVQLVCAQSSKPLVVQDPLQPKPCGFTFVIETPLACPAAVRQPRHIVLTE